MFFVIIISIYKHKWNFTKKKDGNTNGTGRSGFKEIKRSLILAVSLAIVFGLGWGFGLASTSTSEPNVTFVFQIVFSILVGAQGVLLFVLHGVKNSDIRSMWKRSLNLFANKTKFTRPKTTGTTVYSMTSSGSNTLRFSTLPRKVDLSEASEAVHSQDVDGVKMDEENVECIKNKNYSEEPEEYETPFTSKI